MMRVLAWPAFANRDTNPYNALLYEALRYQGVRVDEFSASRLLRGGYDVFHVHWPDYQVAHTSAFEACVRVVRFLGLAAAAKIRGTRIVWTAHNSRSHERRHPRIEAMLWRGFDRLTDGVISLSRGATTTIRSQHPALSERPLAVIPHGHYRPVFPDTLSRAEARRRLDIADEARVIGFIGTLRPYKRIPALVEAFVQMKDDGARLLVAGHRSPGMDIGNVTGAGVILREGFIPDSDIPTYVAACDLIALPYAEILNSGAALLALSLDRPVLLPAQGGMVDLQADIGTDWVRLFNDPLDADTLRAALAWARAPGRPWRVDLARLDWDRLATETLAFYRQVTGSTEPSL